MNKKTIFISGASRGIGREIALRFASAQTRLLLHYRKNIEEIEAVKKIAEDQGAEVFLFAADLSDLKQTKGMIEHIQKQAFKLDLCIWNAAATAFKALIEMKEHHLEKTFNITVNSFILFVNSLIKQFNPASKIITLSGIDTKKYCKNHGLLASAKASLEMLTRYYAIELQEKQIFVMGLNPGLVDTDSVKFYWAEEYQAKKNQLHGMNSLGGMMPASSVAEIIFQMSESSFNWFNGETLFADASLGWMMPGFS